MTSQPTTNPPIALSRFAKVVVVAAFVLIFAGAHTTTAGAGMAFPDWPLSNGSLNPEGWLTNLMMFLEHSHRLIAGIVASMIGVLAIWTTIRRADVPRGCVALAWWSFGGVLAQALLGGLRVMLDPQGIAATTSTIATTFRILHGCAAQLELCLVVALAVKLSPVWVRLQGAAGNGFAWAVVGAIFLQLIVGATMRHLGAGLAIPTFPQASSTGSWMPASHNAYVDLNFTHTRLGAVVVSFLIFVLALRSMRMESTAFSRPAAFLLALVLVQIGLGASVIWTTRQPIVTTLHVVNGAAVLATAVLLAVRLGRTSDSPSLNSPHQSLSQAIA
jgi:heme a synthase